MATKGKLSPVHPVNVNHQLEPRMDAEIWIPGTEENWTISGHKVTTANGANAKFLINTALERGGIPALESLNRFQRFLRLVAPESR